MIWGCLSLAILFRTKCLINSGEFLGWVLYLVNPVANIIIIYVYWLMVEDDSSENRSKKCFFEELRQYLGPPALIGSIPFLIQFLVLIFGINNKPLYYHLIFLSIAPVVSFNSAYNFCKRFNKKDNEPSIYLKNFVIALPSSLGFIATALYFLHYFKGIASIGLSFVIPLLILTLYPVIAFMNCFANEPKRAYRGI